jgi:hypothetical protein
VKKIRFGLGVFLFSVVSLSAFGQLGAMSSLSGVVVDYLSQSIIGVGLSA